MITILFVKCTHTHKKKYEGKANPKNGCVRLIFSFSNLMNRKVTTPQQQLQGTIHGEELAVGLFSYLFVIIPQSITYQFMILQLMPSATHRMGSIIPKLVQFLFCGTKSHISGCPTNVQLLQFLRFQSLYLSCQSLVKSGVDQ